MNFRQVIWREILADPDATLVELQAALQKAKIPLSDQTTGELASEFRRILKFLISEGLISARALHDRERSAISDPRNG